MASMADLGHKAGLLTFGVTGISTVLTLVTSVALARYLGPEGRGLLLALLFWPALLLSIFFCSLHEATIYHVARARSGHVGHDGIDTNAVTRHALGVHIVAAVFITLVVLSLLPFVLGAARTQYLPLVFRYAGVFIPLTILDLYCNAVLLGSGDILQFNMLRLCQPVLYAVALVVLTICQSMHVEIILAVMLLSTGVSVVDGLSSAALHYRNGT